MSTNLKLLVQAPSNIAWLKYMGKMDTARNLPDNPSLSMTLDRLRTWVQVDRREASLTSSSASALGAPAISWDSALPAAPSGEALQAPKLSDAGREKVVRHAHRVALAAREVLPAFGVPVSPSALAGSLVLRSANTFPEASGIASSASSFAAFTVAVCAALAEDLGRFSRALRGEAGLRAQLARLSRQGSGSSCRSFEGPFVKWSGEDAAAVVSGLPEMAHFVLLVSAGTKAVSSSEAHLRVKTSPLWAGRVSRMEERMSSLEPALRTGALRTLATLAWSESWEMHSLFHTCAEPFSYWEPGSVAVLKALAPAIRESEPPVVTMDAGPNVHVSVPASRREEWRTRLAREFPEIPRLEDRAGTGASLVEVWS